MRAGGVSRVPYDSFNLALHVADEPSAVTKNRQLLARHLEVPDRYLTFAEQVHGTDIATISGIPPSSGRTTKVEGVDAMMTDTPDVCLAILTADCVPLLFYDPFRKVIAAAHAGWRGTLGLIGESVILAMQRTFSCNPSDILVGIGPSIGPCCYTVGNDVVDRALDVFPISDGFISSNNQTGEQRLDLWEANRYQLIRAQVLPDHIFSSGICTVCNSHQFFSYRQNNVTGRFASGIMLRNDQCVECTSIVCNWCCRP